ncbi:MAG: hypothetical protein AAF957_06200 [Planctomycetota bacterium]
MARSKGRSSGGGGRKGGGSRRSAEPVEQEIEVVEESSGLSPEEGVAIMTAILLLVAFLMVDYDRGKNYGTGALFAGSYDAQASSSAGSGGE